MGICVINPQDTCLPPAPSLPCLCSTSMAAHHAVPAHLWPNSPPPPLPGCCPSFATTTKCTTAGAAAAAAREMLLRSSTASGASVAAAMLAAVGAAAAPPLLPSALLAAGVPAAADVSQGIGRWPATLGPCCAAAADAAEAPKGQGSLIAQPSSCRTCTSWLEGLTSLQGGHEGRGAAAEEEAHAGTQ